MTIKIIKLASILIGIVFIACGQPTVQAQNLQADLIEGQATYYDPAGNLGFCKKPVPKYAVALPAQRFRGSDFLKLCGKRVKVSTLDGSKSITVPIFDKCFACNYNSIDLTTNAFTRLFPNTNNGRQTVIWSIQR
ncbi:MAG: hypothetical protein HWQ38_00100 [Nostoc sp. NMS7]|uniref:RlpA-like double-psi beta-barrel domain-containing protein n=1 Tax=Nostoc sp. NMS7 TaxID=2815391 RepID=UPI0025CFE731|nr:RlpA-like double-psi beta-barrel domain-containing protein [Nostoc sp. NMS7]MBN3944966.1 hypothetical protein [Nostoc sp. NMS7]